MSYIPHYAISSLFDLIFCRLLSLINWLPWMLVDMIKCWSPKWHFYLIQLYHAFLFPQAQILDIWAVFPDTSLYGDEIMRSPLCTPVWPSVWPGTGLWAAHTHCERQYVLGSDERPCPQGRLDPNGGWGPWKRTREWECTAQQVDGLEFLPIRVSSRVGFHLVASSPGPSASPRWPSPSERKVSIRMVGRWLFWKTWPLPLCSRRFGRSLS